LRVAKLRYDFGVYARAAMSLRKFYKPGVCNVPIPIKEHYLANSKG